MNWKNIIMHDWLIRSPLKWTWHVIWWDHKSMLKLGDTLSGGLWIKWKKVLKKAYGMGPTYPFLSWKYAFHDLPFIPNLTHNETSIPFFTLPLWALCFSNMCSCLWLFVGWAFIGLFHGNITCLCITFSFSFWVFLRYCFKK